MSSESIPRYHSIHCLTKVHKSLEYFSHNFTPPVKFYLKLHSLKTTLVIEILFLNKTIIFINLYYCNFSRYSLFPVSVISIYKYVFNFTFNLSVVYVESFCSGWKIRFNSTMLAIALS